VQRTLSTYLYVDQKLTAALLGNIQRAGFDGVQIFCSTFHFDYRAAPVVREVADWFAGHALKLDSLHAPTSRDLRPGRESSAPLSICDPERVRRLDAVDEIKRAIDVAEYAPFSLLVLHLGGARHPANQRTWDAAFTSLEHLSVFARQRGVSLALENTPDDLATLANLRHFLEDTRLPAVRLCYDSGHAHLNGEALSGLELARDFAATAHIHDNHGDKDEHLLPYAGTIEWSKLLELMPRDLPVVFELRAQASGPSLDEVRGVIDRLEQQWTEAAG
jgi:sugar phosphate isomerase/epimerase